MIEYLLLNRKDKSEFKSWIVQIQDILFKIALLYEENKVFRKEILEFLINYGESEKDLYYDICRQLLYCSKERKR